MVAQQVSLILQLAWLEVGVGEQVDAREVGERTCVDGVRLNPRGRDCLLCARMSEVELDPIGLEQVRQPPPAECGLERDLRCPPGSAKVAPTASTTRSRPALKEEHG
jgi:hypothetical protein